MFRFLFLFDLSVSRQLRVNMPRMLFGRVRKDTQRVRLRKIESPVVRGRRIAKLDRVIDEFIETKDEAFENLTAPFRFLFDNSEQSAILIRFTAYLKIPNAILLNRVNPDALSDRYARDCRDTLIRFLRTVVDTPGTVKRLGPKVLQFVGLSADGTRASSVGVLSRRDPKKTVTSAHLRNQLCHLIQYLRYLTAMQGRKWSLTSASHTHSNALRILKRMAFKEANSADCVLNRIERCREISAKTYKKLMAAQEQEWDIGYTRLESMIARAEFVLLKSPRLKRMAHALQSMLVSGLLIRMPAQRPDQVHSFLTIKLTRRGRTLTFVLSV
jgi:hypothetical protein